VGEAPLPCGAPKPPQLHEEERCGVTKIRNFYRVSSVSPDIEIVPFNNDMETLRRAVRERVFYVKSASGEFTPPPKPKTGVFANRLASVSNALISLLSKTAPMSHQQFVDSRRGRKRVMYQSVLDEMAVTGQSISSEALVKVFVKFEKTDRTSKRDPVPRVISPRSPRYNIRVGRYFKKIEEKIFKHLGTLFGHRTVIKGLDTTKAAGVLREKWEMFSHPVAVGLDASRFDQHVSFDALRVEHKIYASCFTGKHRNRFANLLKYQLKNKCVGETEDGVLKYTTDGTRMSGDMNTSLGNCLLMCLMIKAYATHCGVALQLANNGDDCVVFMEKTDLEKFSAGLDTWFLEMGFNMVVEAPVFEFDEIEFCQTHPVFDGGVWTLCRNPITGLAKDSVLLKDPKNLSYSYIKQWFDAVGTGGMALAARLPVFQSFYAMYQRSGCSRRKRNREFDLPWAMQWARMESARTFGEITPEARASFYYAYGITPDEQVALEEYYDAMSVTPVPSNQWAPRGVF
jgi:hypothetical protein